MSQPEFLTKEELLDELSKRYAHIAFVGMDEKGNVRHRLTGHPFACLGMLEQVTFDLKTSNGDLEEDNYEW